MKPALDWPTRKGRFRSVPATACSVIFHFGGRRAHACGLSGQEFHEKQELVEDG